MKLRAIGCSMITAMAAIIITVTFSHGGSLSFGIKLCENVCDGLLKGGGNTDVKETVGLCEETIYTAQHTCQNPGGNIQTNGDGFHKQFIVGANTGSFFFPAGKGKYAVPVTVDLSQLVFPCVNSNWTEVPDSRFATLLEAALTVFRCSGEHVLPGIDVKVSSGKLDSEDPCITCVEVDNPDNPSVCVEETLTYDSTHILGTDSGCFLIDPADATNSDGTIIHGQAYDEVPQSVCDAAAAAQP